MKYDDFDINSFKDVVINKIIENNEIIHKLDNKYIGYGGSLLYKNIFPFVQNPKTVETTQPFICFKVDHTRNRKIFLEEISVIIQVVCHEKEMQKKVVSYKDGKVLSGTVIDILGEEIKKSLVNTDTNCLGKLICTSNIEDTLYYEYPCRIITFVASKESYNFGD